MSEHWDEMVKQLRGDGPVSKLDFAAIIEALARRAESAEEDVERWRNNSDNLHLQITDLSAEVERLKGVLAEIADLNDNRSDEAAGIATRALEAKP